MVPAAASERPKHLGRPVDDAIKRLLTDRDVWPVYQPIVDLSTGAVVGVEALARGPVGSALCMPAQLFPAAVRAGLLAEVDMLCATRALEQARDAGGRTPPLVFINAEPAALDQPLTPELFAVINSGLQFRIVLEFTERALTDKPARMMHIADVTRSWGNRIALDDVGAEPASLAFLPLLTPDVVKLDMGLLRTAHHPETVDTAAWIADYARRSGATVIAEGIETDADRATAAALGAHWGQGWLFGRPGPLDALPAGQISRAVVLPETVSPAAAQPVDAVTHFGTAATVQDLWGALLRRVDRWNCPTAVFIAGSDTPSLKEWALTLDGMDGHIVFRGVVGDVALTMPSLRVTPSAADPAVHGALTAVAVSAHCTVMLRAIRTDADIFAITFTDDAASGRFAGRTLLDHFG